MRVSGKSAGLRTPRASGTGGSPAQPQRGLRADRPDPQGGGETEVIKTEQIDALPQPTTQTQPATQRQPADTGLRVQLLDEAGTVVSEGLVKLEAGQPVKGGEFRTRMGEIQARGLRVRMVDGAGREVKTEPAARVRVELPQVTPLLCLPAVKRRRLPVRPDRRGAFLRESHPP